MPKPPTKRPRPSTTDASPMSTAQSASTHQQPTLNITFHTIRPTANVPISTSLPAQPIVTSIYDLKTQIGARTGYTPDKIKLLWEKRPVGDSKTLGEVVGGMDTSDTVEMGVMFVGTPAGVPVSLGTVPAVSNGPGESKRSAGEDEVMEDETPVAQGQSGRDVLGAEEFWRDLRGFLVQRVHNEEFGNELSDVFRAAWRTRAS